MALNDEVWIGLQIHINKCKFYGDENEGFGANDCFFRCSAGVWCE
jgi:hypothetical protein